MYKMVKTNITGSKGLKEPRRDLRGKKQTNLTSQELDAPTIRLFELAKAKDITNKQLWRETQEAIGVGLETSKVNLATEGERSWDDLWKFEDPKVINKGVEEKKRKKQEVTNILKKLKEEHKLVNVNRSMSVNALPFLEEILERQEELVVVKRKYRTLKRKFDEIETYKDELENYCDELELELRSARNKTTQLKLLMQKEPMELLPILMPPAKKQKI
eukprot:208179_1